MRNVLKSKTYNPKSDKGFTLIELIIVIVVMAVLTTILVGYSRQSARQLVLTSAQAELLGLFSRAKFLSIETFFQQQGGVGAMRKICAYGLSVDRSAGEVFIFQDRVPAGSNCPGNNRYDSGNDAQLTSSVDRVTLNTDELTFGSGTTLDDVVFIPPDPETVINGGGSNSASVEIESLSGFGSVTVSVNNTGQVRAE